MSISPGELIDNEEAREQAISNLYDPYTLKQIEQMKENGTSTEDLARFIYNETLEKRAAEEAQASIRIDDTGSDANEESIYKIESDYGTVELTASEHAELEGLPNDVAMDIINKQTTIEEKEAFAKELAEARELGLSDKDTIYLIEDFKNVEKFDDPATAHDTRTQLIGNLKDGIKESKELKSKGRAMDWSKTKEMSGKILDKGISVNRVEGLDERQRFASAVSKSSSASHGTNAVKGIFGMGKSLSRFEQDPMGATFGVMEEGAQTAGAIYKLIKMKLARAKEVEQSLKEQILGERDISVPVREGIALDTQKLDIQRKELNDKLKILGKDCLEKKDVSKINFGEHNIEIVPSSIAGRSTVSYYLDGEKLSPEEISKELKQQTLDSFDKNIIRKESLQEVKITNVDGKTKIVSIGFADKTKTAEKISKEATKKAIIRRSERQAVSKVTGLVTTKASKQVAKTTVRVAAKTNPVTAAVSAVTKAIEVTKTVAKGAADRGFER